jgi:hypothetical protein
MLKRIKSAASDQGSQPWFCEDGIDCAMYNSDTLEQIILKAYRILDISFYFGEILVHINVYKH